MKNKSNSNKNVGINELCDFQITSAYNIRPSVYRKSLAKN